MRFFLVLSLLLVLVKAQDTAKIAEINSILLRKEASSTLEELKKQIKKQQRNYETAITLSKQYLNFLNKFKAILKEKFYREELQEIKELLNKLHIEYIEELIENATATSQKSIEDIIRSSYKDGFIDSQKRRELQKELSTQIEVIIKNISISKQLEFIKERKLQVEYLMKKAKKHFIQKNYTEAEKVTLEVLTISPYSSQATSLLKRIKTRQKNIGEKRAKQTNESLLLANTWSSIKKYSLPKKEEKIKSLVERKKQNEQENLLEHSFIPKYIVFNQFNLEQTIQLLQKSMTKEQLPFSVIYKLNLSEISKDKKFTFISSPSQSIKDIVDKITEFFNLSYILNKSVISIINTNSINQLLAQNYNLKSFNISKDFFNFLNDQEIEIKDFFIQSGVKFPHGSSINFVPKLKKLFVRNNPKEIEKIENIITNNKASYQQCSIEAKILEVSETIAQELNLGIGKGVQKTDIDYYDFSETLTGASIDNSLRKGLSSINNSDSYHKLSDASILNSADNSGILTFNYAIGNLSLESTLRALKRSNYQSLLSAPKATVKNGEKAIIKVAEQRYFVNNIEAGQTQSAKNNAQTGYEVTLPPHPIFGDPKELGIIFETEPTINYDNYTISLLVSPQIVEFIRFENILENTGGFVSQVLQTNLTSNPNIDLRATPSFSLPVLSKRSITTTVNLWDGENVNLGGITQSKKITIQDRIPILSSIPIIGTLFKREYEAFEKSELIFFLKASLSKKNFTNVKGIPNFD